MEESLFGFFKPMKEEKKELFDFEFITLVKREDNKNHTIQLSKTAKTLFSFEGYANQKIGLINPDQLTFKFVNLGQTELSGEAIFNITAEGKISSKKLYMTLAEAFELDITEDAYLKVVLVESTNINGDDKTTIEIVAIPDEETIDEELQREEEVSKAQELAESGLIDEEDEESAYKINEDIPESDEFGI